MTKAECISADNLSKPFTIAIVGGGLGGIVLAIGLLRHGIDVMIYEAAKAFGEVGAGIAFSPNSVYALGLISPELLEAYNRHATFNESPARSSTWLTFRYGTSRCGHNGWKPGDVIFHIDGGKHGKYSRSCVHRASFLEEIVRLIPDGITSFNKQLSTLEEDGDRVIMKFRDGRKAWADAVIGCDGIRSKSRAHLYGTKLKPVYSGEYAYRALVPRSEYEAVMGHECTVIGQLYCGYNGYVTTYPVERGEFINMILITCRLGSTWGHETWTAPSSKEAMLTDLTSWHPGIVSLLGTFGTCDKWALHSLPHKERYYRGHICLLGDSAHASTPHMGAGAGQAMEDAYVLSNLISKVKRSEDLEKAFAAYDSVRRPRSQLLIENSRLSGLCYAFLENGVNDDLVKAEERTSSRCRWLWDENLERHLESAVALLE